MANNESIHIEGNLVDLASLCKIQTGKKDVDEGNPNGKYPFFTCSTNPTKSDKFSFDGDAILLPGNGANVGKSFFFNGKFEAYQRTYVLNNFSANAKYIYYFLQGYWKGHIAGKQSGTAVNYVKMGNFTSLKVPLPSQGEQELIVQKIEELFSQLDTGVAGLNRVRELLKQYRASVLKAGIEGKILKKPLENKKWLLIKSGDLFTWANGKALTQKELQKGNIPVFGGNGINGYHHESLMNFPTLIVGRVGVFCGNIFITSSPSWVTDNAIYAKSISEEISLKFSEMIFKSENLNKKASGSGQPFINQRILNEIEINLPSLGDQKFIVDETERQFSIVQQAEQVVKACLGQTLRLRQTILKLAFEGKLS